MSKCAHAVGVLLPLLLSLGCDCASTPDDPTLETCENLGNIASIAYANRPLIVKDQSFFNSTRDSTSGHFTFPRGLHDAQPGPAVSSSTCDDNFCQNIVKYMFGPPMVCSQGFNVGSAFSPVSAHAISNNTCNCETNKLSDICTQAGPSGETCIQPGAQCRCTRSNQTVLPKMRNAVGVAAGDDDTCERFGDIGSIAFQYRPERLALWFLNTTQSNGTYTYTGSDGSGVVQSSVCDVEFCGKVVSSLEKWGCGLIQNSGTEESPLNARLASGNECVCEVLKVADMCTHGIAPGSGCIQIGQNCTCTNATQIVV